MTKGYVLIDCSNSEGLLKLQKMLQKIISNPVEYTEVSENKILLTLKDSMKDVAILKASFSALLIDNEALSKALILPGNNSLFYSYLDFVSPDSIIEMFKVAKLHPEIFDETYDLIASFDKDTLNTIKVYIENDCSPLLSSYALFVHKNTVTYRVNCFIKKTGINLDTFANQMFLYELISSHDESNLEMI